MSTTLSSRSWKLESRLYLNEHKVTKNTKKVKQEVRIPTNHVYCCDISGSMWRSLPKMRTQLKNRLSDVIAKEDTITIIGFASTNECYVLKEMVHCSTLPELKQLHDAIDRWLVDMGCTDFVQPIEKTNEIISRNPGVWNFVFLSDGGHNCSSFSNVIEAAMSIKDKISGSTIIEYGYYADSARLSQMAEILGGTKIVASDFDTYVPVIEKSLGGKGNTAKKLFVEVPNEVTDCLKIPQMFYIEPSDETVHVVSVNEDGKTALPENIDTFYSISKKVVGTNEKGAPEDLSPMYAAVYVASDLLKYDIVEATLATIGDTKYIDEYATAFGKQKLFNFQNEIGKSVFDASNRGPIDPNFKPVDNKYCAVDLFNDLMDEGADKKAKGYVENCICVCSPDFHYNYTSAKSVNKIELTEEEQKLVEAEQQKIANAKGSATKINAATKKINEIMEAASKRQVKMTMVDKPYPISAFTWNEDRANLSAMIHIDVELELPENEFNLTTYKSSVFRNFTLIKDGILNVTELPLCLNKATIEKLEKIDAITIRDKKEVKKGKLYSCIINFASLPILNRKKVFTVKKKTMSAKIAVLNELKNKLKYLGYLKKQHGVDSTVPVVDKKLSQEAIDWLTSLGITEKGYNPKKEVIKSGDFYMAVTMPVKIEKMSSIPKIEDILSGKGKPTPSKDYLKVAMDQVDKVLGNTRTKEGIEDLFDTLTENKRILASEIAQQKFAMIVAHKWFNDCESFDDKEDTVNSLGQELHITYDFSEEKVDL